MWTQLFLNDFIMLVVGNLELGKHHKIDSKIHYGWDAMMPQLSF